MSPFMLLLTAITVVLIGAVMASVVIGNARLERARLAHNEQAARRAAKPTRPAGRGHTDHDRRGRPQVGAAPPRLAIGARADQKPALTATTGPAQQRPEPATGLPPLGAQIRLEDGRTGSVAAIERVPDATRVHLRLDGGGRGHVDIPDTAQPAPGPQPPPTPRPAAVPVPPPPRPAPAATPPPVVVEPARVLAPAKKVASNSTVRLGGFSVAVAPAGRS
jgi:hypothetical protein